MTEDYKPLDRSRNSQAFQPFLEQQQRIRAQVHQEQQSNGNLWRDARDIAYTGLVTLGSVKLMAMIPASVPVVGPAVLRNLAYRYHQHQMSSYANASDAQRNKMFFSKAAGSIGMGIGGEVLQDTLSNLTPPSPPPPPPFDGSGHW